jgi:ATP-dependent DNA ligase
VIFHSGGIGATVGRSTSPYPMELYAACRPARLNSILARASSIPPPRHQPPPAGKGERSACHFVGLLSRGGRPAKRPGIIEPCIPTRASKPPVEPQWIHEIKHDGYRLIARKRDGRVRLFTRRGFDWTERYPRISAAVAALRAASVTIDGEAVCCDDAGVAVFEKLHSRAHDREAFLYAFDPPYDRGILTNHRL